MYEPEPDDMWKTRYDLLRMSILHHMVDAIDADSARDTTILHCVLWGAHAARFPQGDPRRDHAAFAAHYYKTAGEVDLVRDLPALHDMPHITQDMTDLLKHLSQ